MSGSANFSLQNVTNDKNVRTLTIQWTGDAANGTVPSFSSDAVMVPSTFAAVRFFPGASVVSLSEALHGYYPAAVKLSLGGTAPNALVATAKDSDGLDWLLGKFSSLPAVPYQASLQNYMPIDRALMFACSGNTTSSAVWTMVLYLLNGCIS